MFKRINKLERAFGNSLIVKEFPTGQASVEDLKEHLSVLEDDLDFVPHMLVVDYGDIMAPSRSYKEKRFEVGSVFEDLRGLAVQRNIPIWSGKQANRDALSKAVVTMKEISESFEPCKIADLIIALCQTPAEKEDDEMRLQLAKNRNQKSGIAIPIQTGFDRGQFVVKN
jgi:replicative DNA helicase